MADNIIEARGLEYSYEDGSRALSGADIRIKRGESLAVLGGNGVGKSTLFLCLNGVLKPKGGRIYLDGEDARYDRSFLLAWRRRVGIVFQDPNDQLFASTVRRDVSFGAVNLGLSEEEVMARTEEAMEKTGVLSLADKPVHALSFGQKKRVAIAGVLAMKPEVIILDEPTAGLDPAGVSEILKLLTVIRKRDGVTTVISTHEIDTVPLYCDRAYVLCGGRTVMEGTPEDLFKIPEKLREYSLRLPRISHLMEILHKCDGLDSSSATSTISAARKSIRNLVKTGVY